MCYQSCKRYTEKVVIAQVSNFHLVQSLLQKYLLLDMFPISILCNVVSFILHLFVRTDVT